MTNELTLTDKEKALILDIRKRDEEKKKAKALAIRRLWTAYKFAGFMDASGLGGTYSTFCDDFNYEPLDEEESRQETYDIVCLLIDMASPSTEQS